jgi:hypothetical protein
VRLGNRLRRLEQDHFKGGRCTLCRGRPPLIVTSNTDVELDDDRDPRVSSLGVGAPRTADDHAPCPRCGWEPKIVRIVEVVVPSNDASPYRGLQGSGSRDDQAPTGQA